jgi:hypothetical protein
VVALVARGRARPALIDELPQISDAARGGIPGARHQHEAIRVSLGFQIPAELELDIMMAWLIMFHALLPPT